MVFDKHLMFVDSPSVSTAAYFVLHTFLVKPVAPGVEHIVPKVEV
jgi:hypothetical protein